MILKIDQLKKNYSQPGANILPVLKEINLEVKRGETISITGQSGSGKTTLLSLLAGLDQPSSGSVILDGENLNNLSENQLARFRGEKIGIIFQQFHLMPHLNALENVSLPLELLKDKDYFKKSMKMLKQVGLEKRQRHFPNQLSGGECQRVAIARALVTRPSILLADEPTGNLDAKTGVQVMNLLFDIVSSTGITLLMVTHNPELALRCQRQLQIKEGHLS